MKTTFDFDISRNWKSDPDRIKNAQMLATYRDRFGKGEMFVPDITQHTNNIACLTISASGNPTLDGFGLYDASVPGIFTKEWTDGIIVTGLSHAKAPITIAIRVADCGALVLRYADEIMAIVHAGWRGTANGIVRKTLEAFRTMVGADNMSLVQAAISPMAVDGYEFGTSDYAKFFTEEVARSGRPHERYFQNGNDSKGVLRLHELICDQLTDGGVSFSAAQADTLDLGNSWPSHRKFSQGNEQKQGRLLGSVTFTP